MTSIIASRSRAGGFRTGRRERGVPAMASEDNAANITTMALEDFQEAASVKVPDNAGLISGNRHSHSPAG